jgi:hypothetical protein
MKEDVREAQLRRMLHRTSSYRRAAADLRALNYGGHMIANLVSDVIVFGDTPHPFSWSLDDVEKFLAD